MFVTRSISPSSYALSILLLSAPISFAQEKISFNQQIRPILNRSCTGCHGGVKKAGEVSFIYRAEALGKGESGKSTIVPGHPEKSEMIRRIKSKDKDIMMPDPGGHAKPLTQEEIELLTRWVKEGAEWEQHWAYIKPKQTTAKVSNTTWAKKPMDNYVLQRLEQNKLTPTKEASKAQWLRRASLDLTGLPPTLEGVKKFEANTASDAYEQEVDRLLASPRFGERWATVWMDLARYADTKGYEKDPHRNIWPYRDWLINSFNKDYPYNLFLRDQMAGDLLPNPTTDQMVATAFHRNTQTNTEGGTDDEEFRVMATIDRVNTTWIATQGITFGCTQCHSHPYEPIPHEAYYQFNDFFNNSQDVDLNSEFPNFLVANDPKKREQAAQLQHKLEALNLKLNNIGASLLPKTAWQPLTFTTLKSSAGKLKQSGDSVVATGTHSVNTRFNVTAKPNGFTALRVAIIPIENDPKKLPIRGSVLSFFEAFKIQADGKRVLIPLSHAFADSLTGPYKATDSLHNKREGFGGYPKLFGRREVVFIPTSPVILQEGESVEYVLHQKASTTGSQAVTIRKFSIATSNDGLWSQISKSPDYTETVKQIATAHKALKAIPGTNVPVLKNRNLQQARETRLFIGGLWLNKGEIMHKGVPDILNEYNAPASNRLEMAAWLTHKENPQTARVMVNRLFSELFGRGIVETLGDFGSTGTKPSNLALLDHLAIKYQSNYQWSNKKILKDMVLSATYRQDHRSTPALTKLDPQNHLLARGPRTRLTAEMLRDNALASSGLVHHQTGGASVMPPQPDGVWQTVYSGAKWKTATGPNRYRRALYTYWKRTSPYPSMLTFDAPTRDVCTPQRITTNTPLHALVTLNDPVYLECSQALAKRMTTHSQVLEQQINFGYQVVTQRKPNPAILKTITELYLSLEKTYQKSDYKKLADSPQAAAMVILANAMLNLDDAITK